jgi:hypothetical protein
LLFGVVWTIGIRTNFAGMASDEAFISILNAVLAEVCSRCNFVHAEALQPSGAACMVQSGANYSTTSGGADFHRARFVELSLSNHLSFYFLTSLSLSA